MLNPEEKKAIRKKTIKPLAWVAIVSIVMLFAGLTSAYILIKGDALWVQTTLPEMFNYSTAVIVISSLTMIWATRSAKNNNLTGTQLGVGLTLILGIAFTVLQFYAWGELLDKGQNLNSTIANLKGEYGTDYLITYKGETLHKDGDAYYLANDRDHQNPIQAKDVLKSFNSAGSLIYVFSGVHLAHLAVAMIVLLISLFKALGGRYQNGDTEGLEAIGTFWHFFGGLWIYLYLFLLFIR